MNPVSATVWSWRTLRGHSITFAVLFSSSLLGLSVLSLFREALDRSGAPWYLLLAIPAVVIGVLAKKELAWLPDPAVRRKWARRIFFGSFVLAGVLAYFKPPPPPGAPKPPPVKIPFHKIPR